MTSFTCQNLHEIAYTKFITGVVRPNYPFDATEINTISQCTISSSGNISMPANNFSCQKLSCFQENGVFNVILFSPTSYDAGFILSDILLNLLVTNMFPDTTVTVNSIVLSGTTDLTLNFPATPFTIAPLELKTYPITINQSGSPFLNASITFNFDTGFSPSLSITGFRIEKFSFLPNWKGGVNFSFSKKTRISKTVTHEEQRGSIESSYMRKQTCNFWFNGFYGRLLHNTMLKYYQKQFGIPDYSEPMTSTNITTGTNTITVKEEIQDHYINIINQTKYVMLIKKYNQKPDQAEVKELISIVGKVLTFTDDIVGTFEPAATIIYPMFVGMVSDYQEIQNNGDLLESNIEFRETEY